MEEANPEINATAAQSRTRQLIEIMQPIIGRVQSIVGKVRGLAWVYLAGALLLWGIAFFPFTGLSPLMYALAGVVLVLVLIPSIILLLFHMGLQTVIQLPARLLEKAGVGEAAARSMLQAVNPAQAAEPSRKAGKMLGTLAELRTLVLDSKDMLIEYTALLRLANPFVLGIVGIATVAGFGVVIVALIALTMVAL